METKHTPGPWYYNEYPYDDPKATKFEIIYDDSIGNGIQYPIADIQELDEQYGNAEANAKLIAAAPDLLEACQEGYDLITDICNAAGNDQPYSKVELERICVDIWDQMHKAIQKATD